MRLKVSETVLSLSETLNSEFTNWLLAFEVQLLQTENTENCFIHRLDQKEVPKFENS